MPITRGGQMLRDALDSVVRQTHADLDIVLSDNGSVGDTAAICKEYAARDARIRYFRHDPQVTGLANFRFCFEQSRAPWFMWAADDDLRSENYVETLLRGFARNPAAAIVFTDTCVFENRATLEPVQKLGAGELEPAVGKGAGIVQRYAEVTRSFVRGNFIQHYGLFRSRFLDTYDWGTWDLTPILFHMAARGDLCHEPGATFYNYIAPDHACAGKDLWRDLTWQKYEGIAWGSAKAAIAARVPPTPPLVRWPLQTALFLSISRELHHGPRSWAEWYVWNAYQSLPEDVKRSWRAVKRRVPDLRRY